MKQFSSTELANRTGDVLAAAAEAPAMASRASSYSPRSSMSASVARAIHAAPSMSWTSPTRRRRTSSPASGAASKMSDAAGSDNVGSRSSTDGIDTGALAARFFLRMMAAFGEVERDHIRELAKAGLAAAGARGGEGGCRPKPSAQIEHAKRLLVDRRTNLSEVAGVFGIATSTLYRPIDHANFPEIA